MQTVITYYKNLTRWDVKYFASNLYFGDGLVALREFLIPRTEKIKKDDYTGESNIVEKITFNNGVVHFRDERKTGMDLFKGYKGDLLTSKINIHQGAVAICPQDLVCSTHYYLYQINDKKIIPEYLILALRSESFLQKIIKLKASSIKNETGPKAFLDFKIYAPDISEQEKIVSLWRKSQKEAQELNKKACEKEKAIDVVMSKELGIVHQNNTKRSGVFCVNFANLERWDVAYNAKELLTNKRAKYEWVKLKRFCQKAQYGYTGSAVEKDTGTKFLRITDLDYSGNYMEENLPFVEILRGEQEKYLLNEKDFVVARTGATAGKCAIAKKHSRDVVFASYLIRFRFTKDIDLAFLEQYLNQGPGKRIVSEIVYSSGQPNINANEIQEIKIPLPPLPKQKEITRKVEAIRVEIAETKAKASEVLETTQKEIGEMLKA